MTRLCTLNAEETCSFVRVQRVALSCARRRVSLLTSLRSARIEASHAGKDALSTTKRQGALLRLTGVGYRTHHEHSKSELDIWVNCLLMLDFTGLFCKIKIASGSGVDLRFEMGVGVGGHTLLNSRFCDACLVEAT